MTLLASQIPILYCLMYVQSNRRTALNPSLRNSLLSALTTSQRRFISSSSPRRSPLASRLRSHTSSATTDNTKEWLEREKPNLEERSWVRHQDTDLRQLCLERYSDSSQPSRLYNSGNNRRMPTNFQTDEECARKRRDGVRQIMSERFMTVKELENTLLPEFTKSSTTTHKENRAPTRRYKSENLPYANMKTSADNPCSACNTEIGYEVMTQVQDFKGNNYTVINFEDAFQFIPAGRCVNENSPCGGGGNARCVQMYRAQWTLVWTSLSGGGTRLLAHEVPSHCQCINVAGSSTTGDHNHQTVKKHSHTRTLAGQLHAGIPAVADDANPSVTSNSGSQSP